jgi:hypothetical protein
MPTSALDGFRGRDAALPRRRVLQPDARENILGDFSENNVFYLPDEAIEDGEGCKFIPAKNRERFPRMTVD